MNILKFSYKYLNKPKLIIYLIISLISWCISIYLPLMNGSLIDILTLGHMKSNVYNLYIVYSILLKISILTAVNILLTYFLNISYAKLLSKTSFEMNYHILDRVKRLSIFFFHNKNSAYLSQRLDMDTTAVSQFILSEVKNLIINILSLIMSSIILININLKISALLIILIPLYLILYLFFKKKLYKLSYKYKECQNLYFSEINSQIENIQFVKFNSLYSILNETLRNKFGILFSAMLQLTKVNNVFTNSGMLITVLANILILIIGIQQILAGKLSIGQFTIITTYFNTIISGVNYCLSFMENYQNTLVSYNRINELLDLPIEDNGTRIIKHIDSISIENLYFKYSDRKDIISDLNYIFKKGFIYKINGINGSGKSSLVNIITGLYTRYLGTVKYNDISILDLDMYTIRKNLIGIVEQEPTLLKDSILNNITYNLNTYDMNVLTTLIKNIKLDAFVFTLKDGLNTNLSEKSCNISGGEKQKISIIRTILKNPDVIILDEANSALDQTTTYQLSSMLKNLKDNKIIILISHNHTFDDIVDFNVNLEN
ncbi:ABC transporter ATP-binding protein/permease [Clostridium felsineum]|uniref:ATP-binding cassette domain-containing protein n=1 Tax=Clostridium felsineum TaxID=36839 RepID=UPI00214D1D53|nr:ABC transporter ATP-binding protein [Clostridium felsineum]MCR3758711.1 ABC transporter ATP-binding protein/permease [Clostridium felsineum]